MKLWRKTRKYSEGKYLVMRRDGSVPEWPYFVLGARDPAAPAALLAYATVCEAHAMDPEYVRSIRELANEFAEYARQHGHGKPDGEPDLMDSDEVLEVMRGGTGRIYAYHRSRKEPLAVWTNDHQYVIATKEADAVALVCAFLFDPPSSAKLGTFYQLSDNTNLIVTCDEQGVPMALSNRGGLGIPITKSCEDWVRCRGRGFLTSVGR